MLVLCDPPVSDDLRAILRAIFRMPGAYDSSEFWPFLVTTVFIDQSDVCNAFLNRGMERSVIDVFVDDKGVGTTYFLPLRRRALATVDGPEPPRSWTIETTGRLFFDYQPLSYASKLA